MVEHGDRVVDDLGAVGPDALTAGAQARDRRERRPPQVSDQQSQQLVRRRRRRSRDLELEPREPARQLQLPEPLAVLEPVAERDAPPGKAVVGRVVVGRDEEPRLDRLAAELGQREVLARLEASPPARPFRESPSVQV